MKAAAVGSSYGSITGLESIREEVKDMKEQAQCLKTFMATGFLPTTNVSTIGTSSLLDQGLPADAFQLTGTNSMPTYDLSSFGTPNTITIPPGGAFTWAPQVPVMNPGLYQQLNGNIPPVRYNRKQGFSTSTLRTVLEDLFLGKTKEPIILNLANL